MDNTHHFIENFLAAVDFQDPVNVNLETVLTDLPEWDSLAALGVIVMFDIEYGKTITGEHLKACNTIKDLHKLLDN
jgi:acyl carrier protein